MRTYFALVFACLVAVPGLSVAQREDTAATWVARNCGAVYDRIFQEPSPPRVESGQIAIFVSLGGEWVRDTTIRLVLSENEVQGEAIQSKEKPLCDQLLDLRRRQPALDVETAVQELTIVRRQVSSRKLPELLKHAQRLLSKKVSLRPDETLYFPGRSIQLRVSGFKEEISVSFSVPEPSADKSARWGSGRISQAELRDWVERLLKILELDVAA